ncbi:ABC transporter substrate-binding protein [Microvirga sp. 2YAF29]|uniref:ABC transporter substrate-binding protein n=1 Tax=Microvirga sp. 2YAF29 TaxID=3233031 RepID=UPI003F9C2EC0
MKKTRREFLGTIGATGILLAAPSILRAQGQESFRIGAILPLTGSGSTFGPGMLKSMQAALEVVNAAGGAAGRKLELISEDDQTQPQSGVLAAKKLIDANRVQAIIGTWASSVSLAVAPLTNDANILLMHTSGAPALSIAPANAKGLAYRFEATNDRYGRAFAEVCAREGFKRPATMAFNNASGIGNVEGFRKAWEAKGNKILASVVYEPNQASYRSELQKVLAADPDVIVMGSYLADTTIILREWYQSGQPVKFVMPGFAANPDLAKALGPDVVEGIIGVNSIPNETGIAYATFDEAYKKATGQPGSTNPYAAMTWDMIHTLALAIEAAQSADTAAINAKIREIANPEGKKVFTYAEAKAALKNGQIDFDGASSILDFDQYGDASPDFGANTFTNGQLSRKYVVRI